MQTILIIEDEELMLEIYKDTLEREGYSVFLAINGATSLEYLGSTRPDLVILDIKLPDISGLLLLDKIKQQHPDVPVIMCTAYDTFKDDHDAISSKIADYIVKPVVLGDLKERVRRILGAANGT